MARYSLIEYSDACLKTSGSLWQHYRGNPAIDNNEKIIDLPDDNNSSIKNLNNFWRALEMPLINCEISLQWSGSVAMFNVHCSVAMI